MSKKRHTRAPWLAGVKKRHSHAHSPGNVRELKWYKKCFFYTPQLAVKQCGFLHIREI